MSPQVVAHRGASYDIAEHTLGAYVAALDAGADALECDVRLTADGHLVCVHDRTLRRTAGASGLVSTMELKDLEDLDFASWKKGYWSGEDEAPDGDERLRKVLTLRTLLETVRDYDRRVEVAIETKHPTRYGGLTERRLVELLGEFGWIRRGAPVRVMSFSFAALQRIERLAPDVRLVQLLDHNRNWPLLRHTIGPDWAVGPGIGSLMRHPRLGPRILAEGHPLHVWTVNTEEQVKYCLDLGVSAIISDRPSYVLELLGR